MGGIVFFFLLVICYCWIATLRILIQWGPQFNESTEIARSACHLDFCKLDALLELRFAWRPASAADRPQRNSRKRKSPWLEHVIRGKSWRPSVTFFFSFYVSFSRASPPPEPVAGWLLLWYQNVTALMASVLFALSCDPFTYPRRIKQSGTNWWWRWWVLDFNGILIGKLEIGALFEHFWYHLPVLKVI